MAIQSFSDLPLFFIYTDDIMRKDRTFYFHAEEFIHSQTNPTTCIYSIPVGYGHTNYRAPAIYIALPASESDDHISAVCCLFHEYGHWLDMERWLNTNEIGGDSRLSALKYNDYLQEIGVLGTPSRPQKKEAILENERSARKFGKEGLLLEKDYHKGLVDFCCNDYVPKDWLLRQYDEFSDRMYQSYLDAR